MPALVNSRVGSLRGTSGEDGTMVWPRSAKNSRNPERTSERLFMGSFVTALKNLVTHGFLLASRSKNRGRKREPEPLKTKGARIHTGAHRRRREPEPHQKTRGAAHSQAAPLAEESYRAANPETT